MQGLGESPPDWLARLAGTYSGVRFPRGVVGKTSNAMMAVLGLWVVIAWRWSSDLKLDAGLSLIGLAATGAFIWWTRSTQTFAAQNPAQAILEGAEFLQYQQFEAQMKGYPKIIDVEPVSDPQASTKSLEDPDSEDADV
jgi:hypothetical protein